MPLRLLSWNVNGIRAALGKGFMDFFQAEKPDILCLQEVKATPDQANIPTPGYLQYWNPAEKKGYSGTTVFTRVDPLSVMTGMNMPKHDNEGRVITIEYDRFYLVTVYTPNAQRGLARLDYRTREWDVDFLAYCKRLERTKPVVICGDLNVAHTEIDLANPKSNRRNAGFTDEERSGMDRILKAGFIDTFRVFTKEGGHYTWWSYMGKAREKNVGWRIDYFLISRSLKPHLKNAFILPEVMGSDHCPVGIVLDFG